MDWFNSRWYDSSLGRFVQPDSIIPDPAKAKAFDRYAYSNDNPVICNDPSGHCPICFIALAAAIIIPWMASSEAQPALINRSQEATAQDAKSAVDASLTIFGTVMGAGELYLGVASAVNWYRLGQKASQTENTAEMVPLPTGGKVLPDVSKIAGQELDYPSGTFSVRDWTGYPEGPAPRPNGPFRLLEDDEYLMARKAASQANKAIHDANPKLKGWDIHEIHPVKFGGSPTDLANKIALPPAIHDQYSRWWGKLQRMIER